MSRSAERRLYVVAGNAQRQRAQRFIYCKLPYDAERDFQPISLLVHLPNLLVVSPKLPVKSVPELIAYLKATTASSITARPGIGTSSQLSVVMFELATGTHMTHVPFRSTTDELTSMANGSVDLAIDSMTPLWPQAQAGLIRALAVTSEERVASAPDVPTIGETIKGFSVSGWQGLFAPAGTPRPIVDKIAAEVKRVFELPDVVAALTKVGGQPAPMSPDAFAAFIASDVRSGARSSRRPACISIDPLAMATSDVTQATLSASRCCGWKMAR